VCELDCRSRGRHPKPPDSAAFGLVFFGKRASWIVVLSRVRPPNAPIPLYSAWPLRLVFVEGKQR
jgi:hypothetical protein